MEQPSNCSWTKDGPAPPLRQTAEQWAAPILLPLASCSRLLTAPWHRFTLRLLLLITFLKLTRMLANQPPENSFCQNLRKPVAEIKQLFDRASEAGEVSRHLTAREGELLGRGGISTFRAHFFTSWAELFSSSGCVARRGVLCPPYGYE